MQVKIVKRGIVTIPASLREKYSVQAGDIYQIIDLDGVFVLSPGLSEISQLARDIEQMREEAALSMDDLLIDLQVDRKQAKRQRSSEE